MNILAALLVEARPESVDLDVPCPLSTSLVVEVDRVSLSSSAHVTHALEAERARDIVGKASLNLGLSNSHDCFVLNVSQRDIGRDVDVDVDVDVKLKVRIGKASL